MSIVIPNLKNVYIERHSYTLHTLTCAYFQMSYVEISPAPPVSAFEPSHVQAGGQPRFPSPGAHCGAGAKLQPGSQSVGDDGKKEICIWAYLFPGHRTITAHRQMVLLVGITWISHWVFIHPPHKNDFAIRQLFPRALECPLNILRSWHCFAQNKHVPWACGLYFFQGFPAAITY